MVSDPAELTHNVLLRVAEFLRKLPADQLEDLASGAARLEVVVRPVAGALPSRPVSPPVPLPRPASEIGAALADFTDRALATRYLDEMSLSAAQLRTLAKALGIAVPSKATKAQVRDTVVHWTVGRRIDAAILSRPGPARGLLSSSAPALPSARTGAR